jgi:hypothetical protein
MGDGRKGMLLGLPIIEPTCLGLCRDLLRISDLGLDRPRTRAPIADLLARILRQALGV